MGSPAGVCVCECVKCMSVFCILTLESFPISPKYLPQQPVPLIQPTGEAFPWSQARDDVVYVVFLGDEDREGRGCVGVEGSRVCVCVVTPFILDTQWTLHRRGRVAREEHRTRLFFFSTLSFSGACLSFILRNGPISN